MRYTVFIGIQQWQLTKRLWFKRPFLEQYKIRIINKQQNKGPNQAPLHYYHWLLHTFIQPQRTISPLQ